MANFRDYEFLTESPIKWWILSNYCVTLVRDISSQELLEAVGAEIHAERLRGYEDVTSADLPHTGVVDPYLGHHSIGVADLPDRWSLIVEAGFMGVSDSIMGPVAAGHDIVSIYGAEGRYLFMLWVDGVLQSSINPTEREFDSTWGGNDPTRFDEVWAEVTSGATEDEFLQSFGLTQSLFAAMESLTGVGLTEETLTSADFMLGTVPRMLPATESEYSRRLRDAGWSARALA